MNTKYHYTVLNIQKVQIICDNTNEGHSIRYRDGDLGLILDIDWISEEEAKKKGDKPNSQRLLSLVLFF